MESADRSCGTCYACCVYLGVEALNKYSGEKCKHLSKTRQDRRCTIYSRRPESCSRFKCMWLQGMLPPAYRPDRCGVLTCMYAREETMSIDDITNTSQISVTLTITDHKKAGDFFDGTGPLYDIVETLLTGGVNDVRIVNHATKRVIHLRDGTIRHGDLLPPDGPESLVFKTHDPPIGRYEVRDAKEL